MLKIALLILLSTAFSFGQLAEAKRITETLCSPAFHGRGYVNNGDNIAAKFIAEEFQKIGLDAFEEGFLQPFNLDVNTFPNALSVNYNNKDLIPGKHFIVHSSSAGFDGQLVPAVIDSLILTDELKIQAVFEALQSEKKNTFLIDTRNVTAKTEREMTNALLGLSDFAPVVFLTHQKFTWSVARKQSKNPILVVQDSIYKEGAIFRVNIDAEFKTHTSNNVIARLPARKKCAKTIVFTAHFDHLGRMGKNTYFPGANDNASGTSMLLTLAKYFKENPSKYNLVFIAFAGEEAGLVGSDYFVKHPFFKLKKIKFLLNLDILGSGEDGITIVNATEHTEEFELFEAINTQEKLVSRIKKRGPTANSDHYYFTQKNVPAFFIYTMGENQHYHDIFDTYEELSFSSYLNLQQLLVKFVELL
ncbi:MAG: M28 family metallopeptidase [Lishizhenia sp.]